MEMNTMNFVSSRAISRVAELHGVPESEVREEMERALSLVWGTGDNNTMDVQDELFPEGMPALETFLDAIAEALSKDLK